MLQKIFVKVDEITCESCVNAIFYAIKKAGGKDIRVSRNHRTVEFSAKEDLKSDKISKAIEETGYGAKVLKIDIIQKE